VEPHHRLAGGRHLPRGAAGDARVRPQRVDGSKSNDFENFTPGTADSDPISYNIGSNEVCAIRWLESWRKLLLGTPGGEFKMGSETAQVGLTPTNVLVSRETKVGSAAIRPHVVGNALIFVQRQGRTVRELAYDFQVDGYIARDLTLVADHVTAGGVVELAYQAEPAGIVWAARADGQLIGCTYLKEQKVQGWHRHPMTNGTVEAVAVIPGSGADELWLIVRRTINGATKRYVEQMQPPFADDAELEDAWFVDAGLAYSGAPATVFSGLDHLEGQSVDILADGAPHPSQVVASGQITLASAASRVIVGLGYTSRRETMPLEFGQPEGTAQSRKRKIDRVMVRLLRSLGCALGVGSGPVDEVPFRLFGDPLDVPPPLFTGDKIVQPTGGWEDATVWVQQTQPLPLTVLAIAPRVTAYD
jgi:hypothetical protein